MSEHWTFTHTREDDPLVTVYDASDQEPVEPDPEVAQRLMGAVERGDANICIAGETFAIHVDSRSEEQHDDD